MFWNWNLSDVPSIKILIPEPEPHSPKERLRKAISKMCLYTCPRDRTSPSHSIIQKNSMDQVVWEVLDRVRGQKHVLKQNPDFGPETQKYCVPSIRNVESPTSSFPCTFFSNGKTKQSMITEQAPLQTLNSNPKECCYTHSMPSE